MSKPKFYVDYFMKNSLDFCYDIRVYYDSPDFSVTTVLLLLDNYTPGSGGIIKKIEVYLKKIMPHTPSEN